MSGWTVQLLIDCDIVVEAHCSCRSSYPINLAAIRDQLGPDAGAMNNDLAPRIRCKKCGNKGVTLNYSPRSSVHSVNAQGS
jgi:hypothetical protein